MKTPDENEKGLECCTANCDACGECPYPLGWDCREQPMVDALTYIRLLETDNRCLNDTIRNMTELINEAHEETAKVKRERDAVVEDLNEDRKCHICVHADCQWDDYPCSSCVHSDPVENFYSHFEWRGVCPENTEVREDE